MKFNHTIKEIFLPLHPLTFIRHVLDYKIKESQKKENPTVAILSLHPQKLTLEFSSTES